MSEQSNEYGALCQRVTDYDDSIGGEGEILCESRLTISNDKAVCTQGHRWVPCNCGGPTCWGWKVDRTHIDRSGDDS